MLKRCFGMIYRQGKIIDNSRARHLHLTGAQVRYLEIIGDNPGISQDAIAKMDMIDRGAVARAIKRLEVDQYLIRKRNKQDYRAWCLYLTPRGEEVYNSREKRGEDLKKKMFSGFSEEELDTLAELMDRLVHNVEGMREDEEKG